jgi:type II secretory pathway component GspD/PulD (secretin)
MKKLLFGLSLATLASIASAEGKLTDVQWTKVGDGLQVKVTGDDLAQPKIIRLLGGKSFMLEFDARLDGKAKNYKVDCGGVSSVGAYWFQARPAKVRVQLRLDPEAKVSVNQVDGVWTVDVNTNTLGTTTVATNVAPKGTESLPSITDTFPAPVAKFIAAANPNLAKNISATGGDPEMSRAIALLTSPDGTPVPVKKKAEPKVEVKKGTTVKETVETWTPAPQRGHGVDLDFVNTDVVQVLKALALQSNSNIVTAPDVKGQVTVSLQNVSVEEALNLITALSSLHYTKIGNTYVVAANSGVLRQFGPMSASSETRVVPIFSGEGTQIKAAVLKSVPVDKGGAFEMVLPSEQIAISQTDVVGDQGTGTQGGATGGGDTGTKVQQATGNTNVPNAKRDTYVVIIGPADRLDAVEAQVKMIDRQICNALGIDVPNGTALVTQAYYPKGAKASFLLQAMGGNIPAGQTSIKIGGVDVSATPVTSISEQVITFYGRENEVRHLMEQAAMLDQVGQGNSEFMTYELKYSDPRSVKQELENQFPGLQCSIMPSSASNPSLFTEQEKSQSAGGGQASSTTQSGSQATTGEVSTEIVKNDSLSLPFTPYEKTSYPMKLVLRGSNENLARAMAYLSKVDVSPKQVALELRVMDLTKEDARKIGLDWSILTGGTVQQLRFSNANGAVSGNDGTASGTLGFPGGAVANILASLDDSTNNRKLIARPNLLGLDGRQSELFVGDIIRYIESIQSTQNGITVTAKDLSVGVRFSVLPRIGGDGKVSLDMRPVVSSLTGFTAVPGGGSLPQTSLRVVQQTAVINDGETIAIGGLIQDRNLKSFGGVPILKDLPIIGRLFSRETTSKQRTEVVFFLTAKIVDAGNRLTAADPSKNGNYVEPKTEKKDPKKNGG